MKFCVMFKCSVVLVSVFYATMLCAGEISPQWERIAFQQQFDRAVEKCVFSANAFCSAEYIRITAEMYREARDQLIRACIEESPVAHVWAHLFEFAAARSVCGIHLQDENLIWSGKSVRWTDYDEMNDIRQQKRNRVREACGSIVALSAFKTIHKSVWNWWCYDGVPYRIPCNLREYSFSCGKFDAYRLYLYIESVTDAEQKWHIDANLFFICILQELFPAIFNLTHCLQYLVLSTGLRTFLENPSACLLAGTFNTNPNNLICRGGFA